ncbi:TM2 domain-containing protein [Phytohabitans suffuscus]|uniref:TM2 domain-containing protein n=1 Tax=Phytohabitans suffuscus TaxID=624315 RepID=A0A6F8YT73_9ACTN|nr:TM2 domain-containing protein [Phytohabitans suffuscus]BCB89183.1 hypothetical protein Psuf_064960 [Phytohabitans suffuscus]
MTTPPYQPQYPEQPQYGQPQYGQPGVVYSDKSKLVAGLLGIFLGTFGVGRFYTGHTGLAVGQLLVGVFTCGLGGLWGLIDGILILVNGGTDAQGRVLRDS